jgi:hypothetical protein
MSTLMLHVSETLGSVERGQLNHDLMQGFGSGVGLRSSSRPHLYFLSTPGGEARPQALLSWMRERGYSARIVDL